MQSKDIITIELSAINPLTGQYNYADLTFPALSFEIEDAFHRARAKEDGEYFVRIVNSPKLPKLCYAKIDGRLEMKELNLLSKRLQVLSDNELTALGAIFKSKVPDEKASISIEELINMTYDLHDKVTMFLTLDTDEALGEFLIENDLCEELRTASNEVLAYVNPKKVGEVFRESDGGVFYKGNYVTTGGYKVPEMYKSPPKEELMVKNDIAFAILVSKAPTDESPGTLESAEWIYLPIDKAEANLLARVHEEICIEDCVYYDFKSVFDNVDSDIFDDMKKFDTLNEIASRYVALDDMDRIKFKALVDRYDIQSLDELIEISDELNRYDFSYYTVSEDDYGREYLSKHLPANFDMSLFNKDELRNFGENVYDSIGADLTSYGMVSEIDGSLYQLVTEDTQQQDEELKQDEGIGGMSM